MEMRINLKTILLDGNTIITKERLHLELKDALDLPDYYGNNLDALWDCLTTDVELPIKITWINFENSQKYLGPYAQKTLDLFQKAKDYSNKDLIIEVL